MVLGKGCANTVGCGFKSFVTAIVQCKIREIKVMLHRVCLAGFRGNCGGEVRGCASAFRIVKWGA